VTNALKTETWRETQRNMLSIAHSLRRPEMLPFLKKELAKSATAAPDGDTFSIYMICATIAEVGGLEAETILVAALDQLPAKYARWAIRGLGGLGTDGVVARLGRLIDELQNTEGGNPYYVASMLTISGNPAAARPILADGASWRG